MECCALKPCCCTARGLFCSRSSMRDLHVLLVGLQCLTALLILMSPFLMDWEHNEKAPAAVTTFTPVAVDPLARSEALRQHVRNACRALDFSEAKKLSRVTLSHLIYDDKHKMIYCYVPKVACTSWKRVFLNTTGKLRPGENITLLDREAVHRKSLPLLASIKNPEKKLKTYKKFMFVRHPLVRAISAYKDKLERMDYYFHKEVGMKIEKKYRGTTKARGKNITFLEFIRYITEPGPLTRHQQDQHWVPMHKLCDPCSVDYDFIGTMENLEEDADYALKWLGVTELVNRFPSSTMAVNSSQYVSKYLKQLTHKEILKFYAKFLPDYLLFDYELL